MSEQNEVLKLNSQTICDLLNGAPCEVEVFDIIDSTNLEAKRRAASLNKSPKLILAEQQTAGKGRMGRQFYSPRATGLYMSYVYTPETDFSDNVTVTAAAAVAVVRAIERTTQLNPQIKWVNDIYINGKKVCGILTEAVTGQKTAIIVGIGINITTEHFPEEIVNTADSLNTAVDRNRLAAEIVLELQTLIKELPDRTFIDDYRQKSCVLGREVTFIKNGTEQIGTACDIDLDGGLIIKTIDGTVTLNTGEISLRLKR